MDWVAGMALCGAVCMTKLRRKSAKIFLAATLWSSTAPKMKPKTSSWAGSVTRGTTEGSPFYPRSPNVFVCQPICDVVSARHHRQASRGRPVSSASAKPGFQKFEYSMFRRGIGSGLPTSMTRKATTLLR
jgi:hypothetical protein